MTRLPGNCAERFAPVRLLAAGAHGEVWLAEQVGLSREAVVKLLRPQVAALSDELVARFRNEARVTAALAHPGIVVLLDHDIEEEGAWIAYEYIPGGSLADLIADQGPLSWQRALDVVQQMAEALEVAHAAGVVHRDVKPANILVAGRDAYKLADFGIAHWSELSGPLPVAGQVLGSPAYLPPEVRFGALATPSADIFALGITALELITGQTPTSLPAAGQQRRDCWQALADAAPPEVVALVERATAAVAAERFPSVQALAHAAERLLATDATSSVVMRRRRQKTVRASAAPDLRAHANGPPTHPPSAHARTLFLGASAAVAAALLMTAAALWKSPSRPAPSPSAAPVAAPEDEHMRLFHTLREGVEQAPIVLTPWQPGLAAPLVLACRSHIQEVTLAPGPRTRIRAVDGRPQSGPAGAPVPLEQRALRAGVILIEADGPVTVHVRRSPCRAAVDPHRTPPSLALLADELRRRFSELDQATIKLVKELADRELSGRDQIHRRAVLALIDLREKAFWDRAFAQASPGEAFLTDPDMYWTGDTLQVALRTIPTVEALLSPTRDPATGWLELASVLRLCRQPHAARAALVEALSAWPESHWAWFELAKLEKGLGEHPQDPPLSPRERELHLLASLPAFDQAARLMRPRFARRRDDERYWIAHVQTSRREVARLIGRAREEAGRR